MNNDKPLKPGSFEYEIKLKGWDFDTVIDEILALTTQIPPKMSTEFGLSAFSFHIYIRHKILFIQWL